MVREKKRKEIKLVDRTDPVVMANIKNMGYECFKNTLEDITIYTLGYENQKVGSVNFYKDHIEVFYPKDILVEHHAEYSLYKNDYTHNYSIILDDVISENKIDKAYVALQNFLAKYKEAKMLINKLKLKEDFM